MLIVSSIVMMPEPPETGGSPLRTNLILPGCSPVNEYRACSAATFSALRPRTIMVIWEIRCELNKHGEESDEGSKVTPAKRGSVEGWIVYDVR